MRQDATATTAYGRFNHRFSIALEVAAGAAELKAENARLETTIEELEK
jgi:hypothetical protein